jgi:RNA polymerase sigma-70 factor (sigma-E family)
VSTGECSDREVTSVVSRPPAVVHGLARPTFDELYRRRYGALVQIARLTTGSAALAEEIVQDAFAAVLRRFDVLDQPEAYLHRAVVNGCTSWVRRRALERRHAEGPPERVEWSDPDTFAVTHAVAQLPTRQRAVVVLRYFADWSERDIAHAIGCRPGTVKSLLSRARTRLAEELSDDA